MRGRLLTFEGIDGAGKSTQIEKLQTHLQSLGIPALWVREPGGTKLGESVRNLLLDAACKPAEVAELFLFLAARAQLYAEVLVPALEAGQLVICDRFVDSTLAYQGGGRGLSLETLKLLNFQAVGGIRPDCTFLLDLDPQVAAERMQIRGKADRLESEKMAFRRRVRETYLQLAQEEPDRICTILAERTEDEIFADICIKIEPILQQWIREHGGGV